jgi:hypothetical protein
MKTVKIATSDRTIWNQADVYAEIVHGMTTGLPLTLDFLAEGPDLADIGIYDFLEKWANRLEYPLSNITVITANAVERHGVIKIVYVPPLHLVDYTKDYNNEITKNNNLKHFGLFVGRSTAERLQIAAHLHKYHRSSTVMSYHFSVESEFHLSNIGLDAAIRNYGRRNVITETELLAQCPIHFDIRPAFKLDKTLVLNSAQQLLSQDHKEFVNSYKSFFVEIVCESYCCGNTFFPTEKIFRPILLKTPFIVQGPRYFLHRLRDLGFRTFDQWWDEGYSEDPSDWQLNEIIQIVNSLASKTSQQLHEITNDMLVTLEHNHQRLLQLTAQDFNSLRDLHDVNQTFKDNNEVGV